MRSNTPSRLARHARAFFSVIGMCGMLGAVHAADKLVVQAGVPAPNTNAIAIYVAKQACLFRDEGLQVDIQYSSGAPLATQLVASNKADIALVSYEPYLLGHDKGIRGKFFYQAFDRLIYFIGVPVDSDIKTIADLKGKKIGVSNMGSATVIVGKSMLRGAGVEPTDSMFLPVGIGDSAMAALRGGQVQAVALWDAAFAGLERSGAKFRYLYHPEISSFGNGGYFASDRTLGEKRDQLERFSRALAKANLFMLANPQQTLEMYWRANPAGKPAGDAASATETGMAEIRFKSPYFERKKDDNFGRLDEVLYEKYQRMMKEEGSLPSLVPVKSFMDASLLPAANRFDRDAAMQKARAWTGSEVCN